MGLAFDTFVVIITILVLMAFAGCSTNVGQAFLTAPCLDNPDGSVTYIYTDGSQELFADSCSDGVYEDHYCFEKKYVRIQYRNC
ncbi:hypothetical protein HYS47_03395 [Candidatus Woesearchaeota archaeon]|nr:hypothetical protein [Candidatus Woesearchaeota archaeon]